MEEKKRTKSAKAEVKQEFTYEQLEEIARRLSSQCNQLQAQLNEAQKIIDNFNILGMLLSILGKDGFFDAKFTDRCATKIQDLVTGVLDDIDKRDNKAE